METIINLNNCTELLEKCYSLQIDAKKSKSSFKQDPYWISKTVSAKKNKPFQWFLKRVIDVLGSLIGLILLFLPMLVLAIIIKIESRGPILFKQRRIGEHGKEFYMYKFRSMKQNAEAELEKLKKYNQTNSAMFKLNKDPRVTKIGSFIRKYSLDELPQLINVLKGEMSLVGFRPPIERELESYNEWHYLRFVGMPGLSGAWQVNGRSKIKNFDDVVKLEYNYICNWSLLSDIKILLKTIPVVLLGKNTA